MNIEKYKILILALTLACFTSCGIKHYYTKDGGVRVYDTTIFDYRNVKDRFGKDSPIRTDLIYVCDSIYNKWNSPKWIKAEERFVRFFNSGQVLFVYPDDTINLEIVNNPEVGTPGYFKLDGDKLKIDMFQNLNGGQTGKYFGRVNEKGEIVFYEQRPETYYSSFKWLEKAEGSKRFSIWKPKKNKRFTRIYTKLVMEKQHDTNNR